MKVAVAMELWLLLRTMKLPSSVSPGSRTTLPRLARVTSSAPPSRKLCASSTSEAACCLGLAGLQRGVQDLQPVDVHGAGRLVGQARGLEMGPKVHLGGGPGALRVPHEAAVGRVVDRVPVRDVKYKIGGGAQPVPAGEQQPPAGREAVSPHQAPGIRVRV